VRVNPSRAKKVAEWEAWRQAQKGKPRDEWDPFPGSESGS
jgi:hypothetical protein